MLWYLSLTLSTTRFLFRGQMLCSTMSNELDLYNFSFLNFFSSTFLTTTLNQVSVAVTDSFLLLFHAALYCVRCMCITYYIVSLIYFSQRRIIRCSLPQTIFKRCEHQKTLKYFTVPLFRARSQTQCAISNKFRYKMHGFSNNSFDEMRRCIMTLPLFFRWQRVRSAVVKFNGTLHEMNFEIIFSYVKCSVDITWSS